MWHDVDSGLSQREKRMILNFQVKCVAKIPEPSWHSPCTQERRFHQKQTTSWKPDSKPQLQSADYNIQAPERCCTKNLHKSYKAT